MADNKSVDDIQYDDDGNPITTDKKSENEGDDQSKDSDKKEDTTTDTEGEVEDKSKTDKEENTFDDTTTPTIPVRKSNAQFIIDRKNRKIEKLQSKDKTEDKGETDDIETDEEDSNLSEDASKAIESAVDSRMKPVVELLVSKANEEELKDLFSSEPDAKKYENHIKAYLQHDAYKNVPPDVIYHHLAFNNALAIGAKKRNVADKEANLNRSGGRSLPPKNSVSDLPSAEDIADMSDEEFAVMEENARQGKFINKR